MGQKFHVQILNDKEFDSLPYKNISDSLGFADPKKGLAFVRDTGVKEFNLATLSHEIDELVEKHSNHEDEFGIRHKKGGALRTILPIAAAFIPGIGPLLAAGLNVGMNQAAQARHPEQLGPPSIGSAITQGALGYLGGKAAGGAVSGAKAGMAAGKSLGGVLGSAVQGAGTGTFTTAAGGTQSLLGGTGLLGGGSAPLGLISPSSAVNMGVVKPNAVSAATPGVMQGPVTAAQSAQGMTQLPNVLGGIGGGAQAAVPAAVPKTLMENIGAFASQPTNLLGAGSLAASMAPKTPQFEMPPIVSDLRGKLMAGEALSPLGQQARTSLSEIMAAKPTELYAPAKDEYYQATLRRTRSAYEEAQKNLDKAYNAAGVYGSGEHLAAKDKLAQQLTNAETDLYAQTEQRNFELAQTEKFKAMQEALGVDKDQLSDIVGLTGLDIQTAAMIYGAQVEDVKQIRESLGTLGIELLSRQGKMQGTPGININVGQ